MPFHPFEPPWPPRASGIVALATASALLLSGCSSAGTEFDEARRWLERQPGIESVDSDGSFTMFGGAGILTAHVDESLGDTELEQLARSVSVYQRDTAHPFTTFELELHDVHLSPEYTTDTELGVMVETWEVLASDPRVLGGRVSEYELSAITERDDALRFFLAPPTGDRFIRVQTPEGDARAVELAGGGDCVRTPGWIAAVERYLADSRYDRLESTRCGSVELDTSRPDVAAIAVEEHRALAGVEGVWVMFSGAIDDRERVIATGPDSDDVVAYATGITEAGDYGFTLGAGLRSTVSAPAGELLPMLAAVSALPGYTVQSMPAAEDVERGIFVMGPADRLIERAAQAELLRSSIAEVVGVRIEENGEVELISGRRADGVELARSLSAVRDSDRGAWLVDLDEEQQVRLFDGAVVASDLDSDAPLFDEAEAFIGEWERLR